MKSILLRAAAGAIVGAIFLGAYFAIFGTPTMRHDAAMQQESLQARAIKNLKP